MSRIKESHVFEKAEPAVLVTGATGFIGRHVARRLALAGRRVVVLARPRAAAPAHERVRRIFGALSSQMEIVEGDLASPYGVRSRLAAQRISIGTVIHCAAEVRFDQGESVSTRAVQIDGPLALLEMLRADGLGCWAHLSTAFVCGRRSDVVYENEGETGQGFHNSYERLKLESEILLRLACMRLGVDLKIFRPSIVIGAAPPTEGGLPSNLLLAFLRLLIALARAPGAGHTPVRIQGRPQARFNIVPIEYVATAIEQLIDDPAASRGTFHLVASNPPTQKALLEMMGTRLGLHGPRLLDASEAMRNPSRLELRIAKMMLPYREYFEQDVRFDDSGARTLLERRGVRAPVIDHGVMDRLIDLAASSKRNGGGSTKLSQECA